MNLYRMCREISVYLTGEARGLRKQEVYILVHTLQGEAGERGWRRAKTIAL